MCLKAMWTTVKRDLTFLKKKIEPDIFFFLKLKVRR
jgi:hypothetical protein